MINQTHTYAKLPVSEATFNEIWKLLLDAEYGHAIHFEDDGKYNHSNIRIIDMHGIALVIKKSDELN